MNLPSAEEHSNDGLISFPGGIPLTGVHGRVVGAVGVSGSTVEDDHTVAQAGATAAAACRAKVSKCGCRSVRQPAEQVAR